MSTLLTSSQEDIAYIAVGKEGWKRYSGCACGMVLGVHYLAVIALIVKCVDTETCWGRCFIRSFFGMYYCCYSCLFFILSHFRSSSTRGSVHTERPFGLPDKSHVHVCLPLYPPVPSTHRFTMPSFTVRGLSDFDFAERTRQVTWQVIPTSADKFIVYSTVVYITTNVIHINSQAWLLECTGDS